MLNDITVQRCNHQNETIGNFSKTWFLLAKNFKKKRKMEGESQD